MNKLKILTYILAGSISFESFAFARTITVTTSAKDFPEQRKPEFNLYLPIRASDNITIPLNPKETSSHNLDDETIFAGAQVISHQPLPPLFAYYTCKDAKGKAIVGPAFAKYKGDLYFFVEFDKNKGIFTCTTQQNI